MELHLREIEIRIIVSQRLFVCVWWELHEISGMFLERSIKPVDRHSLQKRNYFFTASFFFSSHLWNCFTLIVTSKSKCVIYVALMYLKLSLKILFCKGQIFFFSPSPVANYCCIFFFLSILPRRRPSLFSPSNWKMNCDAIWNVSFNKSG